MLIKYITKYDAIYQSLRREIEAGNYFNEQSLPSENQLIQKYDCSRNTVRRAIAQLRVDEALSHLTGFAVGNEIYCVQRVRFLDGEALILDHNYFLKRVVREPTPTIAEGSVYEYMEQTLGESIVTTRRKYTVERTNDVDCQYIDMKGYNCMTVVSSQTFNKDGIQFEFTQSRHRPDRFVFYELAHRRAQRIEGHL